MHRRIATLAGTAAALLVLLAPSAQAALVALPMPATASSCSALSGGATVFARWLDFRSYTLAPGGDFESGAAGWTLANGARVVSGGNRALGGSQALALPSGATATSPVFCADATNPTFRMFSSNTSWAPGFIHADLVWTDTSGASHTTAVGGNFSFPVWQPTGSMLLSKVLPLLSGSATPVQLRFKGMGGGALLDDVYIDPARGR